MPLFITFGINGSGKDTLAKNILQQNLDIKLLSGSRIMLRGLGYNVGIEVNSPATKEMYDHLESLSDEIKQQMADDVFKQTLLEFKKSKEVGILSSHLIIARRDGKDIIYEKDLIRDWFPEVFDGFIFVKGNPEEIFLRHEKDKQENIRDRGMSSIDSLTTQQQLSSQEWEKLRQMVPKEKRKTIYNFDGILEESSQRLLEFIKTRVGKENLEQQSEVKKQFKPR